jgi:putative PIN family toxin of toxin-antitoxin system
MVMDTDVVVAAMRSPKGASAALLRAMREERATSLLTTALMLEYEAVCSLAEHRLASGLDSKAVEQFLDAIAYFAEPIEVHYQWRPMLSDPGDEMVLETAVNGRAQAIVTFNRRHYAEVPRAFGIEILLPAEALKRIET